MLILASASPRRSELLESVGVEFEVHPADIEEVIVENETPAENVLRLAELKAEYIARQFPEEITLAADTIVVFAGEILGKPSDVSEAEAMLKMLSANTHQVLTAYSLLYPKRSYEKSVVVSSDVSFSILSSSEISAYVATGEPMDKAGSYGVQGIGAGFIKTISGSYTNVVGLPLAEVVEDLKLLGIKGYFF